MAAEMQVFDLPPVAAAAAIVKEPEPVSSSYPKTAIELVAWQTNGGLGKSSGLFSSVVLKAKENIFTRHPKLHLKEPARSTREALEKRRTRTLIKIHTRNKAYMRRKLDEDVNQHLPVILATKQLPGSGRQIHLRFQTERVLVRNNLVVAQLESENADIRAIVKARKEARCTYIKRE